MTAARTMLISWKVEGREEVGTKTVDLVAFFRHPIGDEAQGFSIHLNDQGAPVLSHYASGKRWTDLPAGAPDLVEYSKRAIDRSVQQMGVIAVLNVVHQTPVINSLDPVAPLPSTTERKEMSLEASIQENTAAIKELIAAVKNAGSASQDKPEPQEKQASSKPAADKAKTETKQETKQETKPYVQAEDPAYKSCMEAILALSRTDREKAVAVLAGFKATKVPQLKPEDYAAAQKAAEEALAAEDSLA